MRFDVCGCSIEADQHNHTDSIQRLSWLPLNLGSSNGPWALHVDREKKALR